MYVLYFYVAGCVCQRQISEHVMLCYDSDVYRETAMPRFSDWSQCHACPLEAAES